MSTVTSAPPALCPFLIDGEWVRPSHLATSPAYNPSTGEVIGAVPLAGAAEVDAAVRAAHAAFPAWAATPVIDRARILFRYRALVEKHFDEIARLISREHGKTSAEARGDLFRGLEVVEFACGAPTLVLGDMLGNVARGVDCDTMRCPLGVCVGITPFNFPAMIPLWMYPLALATGNTFVLKPSERVPFTALRLAELLAEAGLPKGVFNLVHGGKPCVDALLAHPLVRAVSFVGSTPIARYIHQTASAHGKRVQANGGAKNYIVVLPDADTTKTVEGVMNAAFGCAGERCMAGSSVLTVGNRGRHVMAGLAAAARQLKVGRTDVEAQPDMGALITAAHRDRVLGMVEAGVKAGAKLVADGRGVKVPGAPQGFYLGATIVEDVQPGMALVQEEVFGPVLNVLHLDDLDAAIALANRSSYGNGASLFTNNGRAAREFKHRVQAGMIGINIGVPASLAMFPFSGWNDSFFGDLHIQGREAVWFYTQQKVTTTRWLADGVGDVWRQ
jgi:malonate-semialdehyde dehydrogenase (acetylating)/methylmalonate-semialdehyde dehydrogenase